MDAQTRYEEKTMLSEEAADDVINSAMLLVSKFRDCDMHPVMALHSVIMTYYIAAQACGLEGEEAREFFHDYSPVSRDLVEAMRAEAETAIGESMAAH